MTTQDLPQQDRFVLTVMRWLDDATTAADRRRYRQCPLVMDEDPIEVTPIPQVLLSGLVIRTDSPH